MRIYSVTTVDRNGQIKRRLWTTYQSAAQSQAYTARHDTTATLEAVNVSDDAWKPVDKVTEARLNRVAVLWEQLVAADQEGLDALLDDLVKRLKPAPVEPKPFKYAEGGIVFGGLLSDKDRNEAMVKLNRLADTNG
jgi:hypothetical protein